MPNSSFLHPKEPCLDQLPQHRRRSAMMSILIVVLIASGLATWDRYFYEYTSIDQKRIAILVHAIAAVMIICVWIVHVYAAIWVRGTISAMTRGRVTGGWAWRHHRKWLKELVNGKERSNAQTTPVK